MISEQTQGHCLCGSLEFTVKGKPKWCANCHCSDCRRHTGSAVATFVGFEKKHFSVTSGEFGSIESSPGVHRYFCPYCGTPMAYESDRFPGEIHVLIGTLNDPEAYPPELQVNCREQLSWLKISIEGPSYQTFPEHE